MVQILQMFLQKERKQQMNSKVCVFKKDTSSKRI